MTRAVRAWRGPFALGALTLAPVVLWVLSEPSAWRGGVARWLTAAGVGFGIAGMAAFALNVVLGARLPAIQRFFGGLEKLYAVHRINGRIVYALVLMHVCLILAGRSAVSIGDAVRLFTPAAGAAVLVGVAAFLAITGGIFLTLYARLTHEMFVYVQRALGATFFLAGLHVFLTAGATGRSRGLAMYLAVLGGAALGSFVYRSLLDDLLVRRYDYVVTEARRLDPSVVEIAMAPVDRTMKARPGQFVFVTFYSDRFNAQFHPISVRATGASAVVELRLGQARDQFHPFSLTSTPADTELRLVVKAVGTFTRALHLLEPGAAARVEGPYGEFSYLNVDNPRQVWLAGGIGITPFLGMARSLEEGMGYEILLYHGVKSASEAFFADELEQIAARVPGFGAKIVPEDEAGFITVEMIASDMGLEDTDFMIVGPPAMESALHAQLVSSGVPERSIHSERFAFGPTR